MKSKTIALFLGMICWLNAAFADTTVPVYTEKNTSIAVSAKQPTFTLKLKSNPTTGYSWSLQPVNSKVIELVKHSFQAPKNGLIGQSGFEVWTFLLKPASFANPQPITIQMLYARPWNKKDNPTAMTFVITPTP